MLHRNILFSHLEASERAELFDFMQPVEHPAGQDVIVQGVCRRRHARSVPDARVSR